MQILHIFYYNVTDYSTGVDPDPGGGGDFLRAHKINNHTLEILRQKLKSETSNYLWFFFRARRVVALIAPFWIRHCYSNLPTQYRGRPEI